MKTTLALTALLIATVTSGAASSETTALKKIRNLNRLIQVADQKGIDTQKEMMTVRVTEVFLKYADWDEANALELLTARNRMPEVRITETNGNSAKGCTWKCVENSKGYSVLSIVNLGNTEASRQVQTREENQKLICTDLIHGIRISSKPVLKPYEVLFVEVQPSSGL